MSDRNISRRDFVRYSAAGAAGLTLLNSQRAMSATAYAPSDRIAVGMLGVGGRAQGLMELIKKVDGTQIVAVCDAYKGRIERAVERTDGKATWTGDYREVLARKDVDAVVIATPDHLHREMLIAAVEAGKDAYIEKPMSWSIEDGRAMVAAVKKTDRIVQVGSQGISSQVNQRAKEIISSGAIGRVTLIRAMYNRNTASGAWVYPIPPDASPQNVDWNRFIGPAPKRAYDAARFFRWRCYWDYSGGIATDLFVHLITTIHFVMGAEVPADVVATGALYRWKDGRDVPDTLNALLSYPEGFSVNLSSTFNNQSSGEGSLQFLGTEGALEMRGGSLIQYPEHPAEGNYWVVDSWPRAMRDEYYKDPKNARAEYKNQREPQLELQQQRFDEIGFDATYVHLKTFFDSMRTRKAPNEPVEVGHRAAAVAHMINQSYRESRAVRWNAADGRAA